MLYKKKLSYRRTVSINRTTVKGNETQITGAFLLREKSGKGEFSLLATLARLDSSTNKRCYTTGIANEAR